MSTDRLFRYVFCEWCTIPGDEVTGVWRKLHSEGLHNFCSTLSDHITDDEPDRPCKGEGTPRNLATATQPQFPRKIANFKEATGFQISRPTLRKLV
jgi:hypothetical protein